MNPIVKRVAARASGRSLEAIADSKIKKAALLNLSKQLKAAEDKVKELQEGSTPKVQRLLIEAEEALTTARSKVYSASVAL